MLPGRCGRGPVVVARPRQPVTGTRPREQEQAVTTHPPRTEPRCFIVWHRVPHGRWKRLAVVRNQADGLALVDVHPPGDYILAPIRDPRFFGSDNGLSLGEPRTF